MHCRVALAQTAHHSTNFARPHRGSRSWHCPPAIPAAPAASAAAPTAPARPKTEINMSAFVSKSDVRSAVIRQGKIFIGPKTTVTPSARDRGQAYEVFVETGLRPPASLQPYVNGNFEWCR